MKKNLILLIVMISMSSTALFAQKTFELYPSVGYLWNGKVQFAEGVLDFKNGNSAGLAFSTSLNKYADIEFDYTWSINTDLEFISNNPIEFPNGEAVANIHHFTLNSVNYLSPNTKVRPFINLGAGAAVYAVDGVSKEYRTRFALNTGLGCKIAVNEKIGIRIQGRILAPLHYEGVGYYASIGTGGVNSGLSLNATAAMLETDIRAGVVFKF